MRQIEQGFSSEKGSALMYWVLVYGGSFVIAVLAVQSLFIYLDPITMGAVVSELKDTAINSAKTITVGSESSFSPQTQAEGPVFQLPPDGSIALLPPNTFTLQAINNHPTACDGFSPDASFTGMVLNGTAYNGDCVATVENAPVRQIQQPEAQAPQVQQAPVARQEVLQQNRRPTAADITRFLDGRGIPADAIVTVEVDPQLFGGFSNCADPEKTTPYQVSGKAQGLLGNGSRTLVFVEGNSAGACKLAPIDPRAVLTINGAPIFN